jgi:metal-responsive CopG/Arc/MetJ family transcriptional regulator
MVDSMPKPESRMKSPMSFEHKVIERSFILRLPQEYVIGLDGLVRKGVAKSRNDLIVEIIKAFLLSAKYSAEAGKNG